jgi:arylsulfatase A-like enzyme
MIQNVLLKDNLHSAIRSGALEGVVAWTVYWSFETFLLHVVPRIGVASYEYMPPSAAFAALLLIIYVVIGLISGGLIGIAVGAWWPTRPGLPRPQQAIRTITTISLCLVVMASALPRMPSGVAVWCTGLLFLPVGLSLLLSLFSEVWAKRLAILASPWMACIALVGPPLLLDIPGATLRSIALPLLGYITAAIGLHSLTTRQAMASRRLVNTAVGAALVLAACLLLRQEPHKMASGVSATAPADTPNVILLTLDTVRADHLSLYGYERNTTPNLARLAQEASVYTHAISPGDMTLSSHASIFTGLYPSSHKAHFDNGYSAGRPLDPTYVTLAELLARKGFDTIGVVANFLYLTAAFGLDRGFTDYDAAAPVPFFAGTKPFFVRQRVRNVLAVFSEPWKNDVKFRRAEEINDAALDLLDREKAQNRRFFLFLNYMDAHAPYLPPPQFGRLYPGAKAALPSWYYDGISKGVLTYQRQMSDRERQYFISQYDGAIAYMDWSFGRFIDRLKQAGLYDNTLLIVTSDHGEAFGERNLMGHALSVYEDETHVPLLIKYPRHTTHAVINDPVSLVALLPTILQVLGHDAPKGIQGRSLLQPDSGAVREAMSETFVHPLMSTWNSRLRRSARSIVSGSMKFISFSNGVKELYDLSRDPNEQHNLYPEPAAVVLQSKLADFAELAAAKGQKQIPVRINPQTVEKLKSLGYVQ